MVVCCASGIVSETCGFFWWDIFCCDAVYTDVKQKFGEMYHDSHVWHHYLVQWLINKRSVAGLRSGRLKVLTKDKVVDISDRIMRWSKMSVCTLCQQSHVSCGSTRQELKKKTLEAVSIQGNSAWTWRTWTYEVHNIVDGFETSLQLMGQWTMPFSPMKTDFLLTFMIKLCYI
jgi:hypothetical protein